MVKLINTKDTYEVKYPKDDTIFVLRKLSAREVGEIEDSMTITERLGEKVTVRFLAGTAGRIKLKYAIVGWKNLVDDNGNQAPCSDVNKDRLPAEVRSFLERQIDSDNGLSALPEDERKKS